MVSPIAIEDARTLGPYRLLRPLGEHVWVAERPGGEPVAVQAVPAGAAADPRFPGQVAAARTLSAARVAPVVETDLDTTSLVGASLVGASPDDASPAEGTGLGTALEADGPWLASAYIAGPSLAELVREQGPLPGPAALELAARLAEGLREMHAAGVVHGNLKPSNVVLAPDGPRLTGYGIWNAAEVPGQDPGFLSPEQVLGQDTGAPADIFSLGAVLAFAAGGHGPFGSGSAAALMYRLVNSRAELDQLDPDVRAVAERGLAKEPADRPTAAELMAVLEDLRPSGEWRELGLPVTVPAPRQPAAEAQAGVAAGPAEAGPLAGAGAGAGAGARTGTGALAAAGAWMGRAWQALTSGNRRNGGWRALAPVWITGSVLAVLAAVVLLATGIVFPGRSGQAEPQAGAVVAATGSQQAPAANSAAGASSGPASAPGQAKLTRVASSSPLIAGGSSASVFVSLPAVRAAAPAVVAAAKAAPAGAKPAGSATSTGPGKSTAPAKSAAPTSKPSSSAPSASATASASPTASSGPSASPSAPAPSASASAPDSSPPASSAPASSAPASSPPGTSSADPSSTASGPAAAG